MEASLKNRLNAIVGNTYNYKGKDITIDKVKEVGVTNTVVFAPSPLNFLNHELTEFLDSLHDPIGREVTKTEVLVPENKLMSFEPTKDNSVIKNALLDTLEKVKNDPTYLPQAKAICQITNNMINLQKNEIEMLTVLNKFK